MLACMAGHRCLQGQSGGTVPDTLARAKDGTRAQPLGQKARTSSPGPLAPSPKPCPSNPACLLHPWRLRSQAHQPQHTGRLVALPARHHGGSW